MKNTINNIITEVMEEGEILKGATEEEIIELKNSFKYTYNFDIPEAYLDVLRMTNGLMYNGLKIWPTLAYGDFKESLISANFDYRMNVRSHYFYFCSLDSDIYVYDTNLNKYLLIDLHGHCVCETFDSCQEMLESALLSAWNSCGH